MKKNQTLTLYTFCYLNIRPTKNNIFITLSTYDGKVILKASAGIIHFSGKKKRTAFVAESVVKHLLIEIKEKNIKIISLWVKVFGSLKHVSVRRCLVIIKELQVLRFRGLINHLQFSHNGMRKKKKRL